MKKADFLRREDETRRTDTRPHAVVSCAGTRGKRAAEPGKQDGAFSANRKGADDPRRDACGRLRRRAVFYSSSGMPVVTVRTTTT